MRGLGTCRQMLPCSGSKRRTCEVEMSWKRKHRQVWSGQIHTPEALGGGDCVSVCSTWRSYTSTCVCVCVKERKREREPGITFCEKCKSLPDFQTAFL